MTELNKIIERIAKGELFLKVSLSDGKHVEPVLNEQNKQLEDLQNQVKYWQEQGSLELNKYKEGSIIEINRLTQKILDIQHQYNKEVQDLKDLLEFNKTINEADTNTADQELIAQLKTTLAGIRMEEVDRLGGEFDDTTEQLILNGVNIPIDNLVADTDTWKNLIASCKTDTSVEDELITREVSFSPDRPFIDVQVFKLKVRFFPDEFETKASEGLAAREILDTGEVSDTEIKFLALKL